MLTPPANIPTWIHALPKVELHCHLEGAFPIETLWELVQKYGPPAEIRSLAHLENMFLIRDFKHFFELWIWKNTFLRSYEDFVLISSHVAARLQRQNVHYAEIFFSPSSWIRRGFEPGLLLEAIQKGFAESPHLQVQFIADLVRDFGPEHELFVLEQLKELKGHGLIGIGLGGSENKYPAPLFSTIYAHAQNLGFHTTIHAGEMGDPQSIWDSIKILGAERIGHGIAAYKDPRLIDFLRERNIPLELCPYSNVCTGAVASLNDHPLRQFLKHDLLISLNTDDPLMFGNSLDQEYELAIRHFQLQPQDIRKIILNSIKASWLEEKQKIDSKILFEQKMDLCMQNITLC